MVRAASFCFFRQNASQGTRAKLTNGVPMSFRVTAAQYLAISIVWSSSLLSQQHPVAASVDATLLEFPVALQQTVEAGKTSVGTKIQAKLLVATLVNRVVIPENALFSGAVIESVAKTKKGPSRLAIRIDSVAWKNGSAFVTAYLTSWYYPRTIQAGQSLQYRPPQPDSKTWDGAGQYPSADSRVYERFPNGDSDQNAGAVPDTASSKPSNRPARMNNVKSAPTQDGGIALVCEHANLKFNKLTTYVLVGLSAK
jgi:hypothetical protein